MSKTEDKFERKYDAVLRALGGPTPAGSFRGDEPPELTAEDEAALDRAWAAVAREDAEAQMPDAA